jgi:hypothetical protein
MTDPTDVLLDSAAAARQVCAEFFLDDEIPPRAAVVLEELFG